MKVINVVLVLVSLSLIAWIVFFRDRYLAEEESFAGSDWNTAFWGQSLWNGWNYASAPFARSPIPEDTSIC